MAYYRCTISYFGLGPDDDCEIIVHWDDNDPNRFVQAPWRLPTAELDEARLVHELGRMGFRLVSTDSDNVGRGWAIVQHLDTDRPYYNPLDRCWYAYLSDDAKREIAEKYPDAVVPGVR